MSGRPRLRSTDTDEIKILTRVCRFLRKELGREVSGADTKYIADLALALFISGITDEADLIRNLRRRLKL
jgi:hypothetical protein